MATTVSAIGTEINTPRAQFKIQGERICQRYLKEPEAYKAYPGWRPGITGAVKCIAITIPIP